MSKSILSYTTNSLPPNTITNINNITLSDLWSINGQLTSHLTLINWNTNNMNNNYYNRTTCDAKYQLISNMLNYY
jgi:hypothetical protein